MLVKLHTFSKNHVCYFENNNVDIVEFFHHCIIKDLDKKSKQGISGEKLLNVATSMPTTLIEIVRRIVLQSTNLTNNVSFSSCYLYYNKSTLYLKLNTDVLPNESKNPHKRTVHI